MTLQELESPFTCMSLNEMRSCVGQAETGNPLLGAMIGDRVSMLTELANPRNEKERDCVNERVNATIGHDTYNSTFLLLTTKKDDVLRYTFRTHVKKDETLEILLEKFGRGIAEAEDKCFKL